MNKSRKQIKKNQSNKSNNDAPTDNQVAAAITREWEAHVVAAAAAAAGAAAAAALHLSPE